MIVQAQPFKGEVLQTYSFIPTARYGVLRRIKKLILVAPWKIPDRNAAAAKKIFYNFPIDTTIKERVKEIVLFTADDEEENGKKSLEIYHQALEGKIIELKKHGHYTLGDMKTEEFPELIKEIVG